MRVILQTVSRGNISVRGEQSEHLLVRDDVLNNVSHALPRKVTVKSIREKLEQITEGDGMRLLSAVSTMKETAKVIEGMVDSVETASVEETPVGSDDE